MNLPAMQETSVWSLSWEDPLEKGTGTHPSILVWRIPRTIHPWGCKESDMTDFHFQFSSVAQSCPTLRDPMNCSTPGLPVHHQLPEFTQIYIHQVSDAIQPSHPLSSPSPPAPNPSQHQSLFPMSQLFAWGDQSIGVSALASFLPKKSQGWSPSEGTGWISLQSKGLSRVFSNTTVLKHQFFSTQLSLWSNSHSHTRLLEKP